jgi:endonuclease VIII
MLDVPEGPSIYMLREEAERFAGRRILRAAGNAKVDMSRLAGEKVRAVRSWGKHFLIELPDVAIRVHFLMFGSYTIDSRKDREPRLRLTFPNGEINFYSCAVRLVEGPLDEAYDWSADVMSADWDPSAARSKLREMPRTLICDALLDQDVFAGVGNIIKNEVLFTTRVHPRSEVAAMPASRLRALVDDARTYSFEFLKWKRKFQLRKHWLVHNRGLCPSCGGKLTRAILGKTARRCFFCERCQKLYADSARVAKARHKAATRSKAK